MDDENKLLIELLRSEKKAKRNVAIEGLLQLKEKGLPLLLQALKEEVSDRKKEKDTHVKQFQTKKLDISIVFVPPEDAFSENIIQNIKILIARIGDFALSSVCDMLKSEIHGDPVFLFELVDILRKIGNKEATPYLLPLLSHQDFMVQINVIYTLQHLRDKRALSKLKDLLVDRNTDSFIRNEIEIAIRQISDGLL